MSEAYDVSGVLPGELLDSVPAGTNLGVVGPSMTGKRELAIRLLSTGFEAGDGVLCITTKDDVSRILDSFERHVPSLDRSRIGVIDCSGSVNRQMFRAMTERVSSPSDLTGISIGMAKLSQQFERRGITDVRHGLISVSTLLRYLSPGRVFKFLHIYTRRVQDTNGFGVYTLDDDAHDPQVVNTITGQLDGVVRLRETDSADLEFQLRGFGRRPTGWTPLE